MVNFDFRISSYPTMLGAGAPTLMQEVFQARLRHRRSSLCFRDRLGFLPTASPTSTWCQTTAKKSLERMNGDKTLMHYHRTPSQEYEAPTTTHNSLLLAELKLTIYGMVESGGLLEARSCRRPR